tara:strand:+ start:47 stop:1171 length:1125 start_codon:yes stop_codon:yes gene_type:complete
MAKNLYISDKVKSEQELYENIVIESLKIYGQEVYYIPRDLVNEDTILGDDPVSSFNSAYKVEMYVENVEGFDGEGDLFTRFGVEIRDEATFVVARRRWSDTVARYDNEITVLRPKEGDLIYLELSKSLFQINHVEHEQPFYQLSNLPVFKLRCSLFEYTGEDLDTGVETIDNIETKYAYTYILTLSNTRDSAEATATIDSSGTITAINLTDSGNNYFTAPTVTITDSAGVGSLATATATVDSNSGELVSLTLTNGGSGYVVPRITFSSPAISTFVKGEVITSQSGTTTMRGEVAKYSDSDSKLHLIHAGADDGKFHNFTPTKKVIGLTSGAGGVITLVTEDNKISENEQNADFSLGTDFIDFSETNPFGDTSNN